MNQKDLDKEFGMLEEFLCVRIQLSLYGIRKYDLPTFEHFKKTYNDDRYSMSMGSYKDSLFLNSKGVIIKHNTAGLGTENGIAYRFYNYWKGNKYYVRSNVNGCYYINGLKMNNQLLKMDKLKEINELG